MNQFWRVQYKCDDDIYRSQVIAGDGLLSIIQEVIRLDIALDDIVKIELEEE